MALAVGLPPADRLFSNPMTRFFRSDIAFQIVPLTPAKWMLMWLELKTGPGSSRGKLQGVELPEIVLKAILQEKITNGNSIPTTLQVGSARIHMMSKAALLFHADHISIIEENHFAQLTCPPNE